MDQLILGVITGVVTTFVLFVFRNIWQTKVTPYFKEVRYQGVKVDGSWDAHSKDDEHEFSGRLFIVQSAHDLSGDFFFSFKSETNTFDIDFKVQGYMWEGYLTLNFIPKNKKLTSYATSLFKLHAGGVALVGQICFRNVNEEVVSTLPMYFNREKLD